MVMAIGQQVLSGVESLELLRAAEEALEASLPVEGQAHVGQLRAVLTLHELYAADGLSLSATPAAARLLRCSDWRAGRMLDEAMLLTALPQALDAIASGVLTVDQSSVVVTHLRQVTDLERRLLLWRRLLERLRRPDGAVLPPARLQELLKHWIVRSDPADAEQRRKAAEDERRVEYRRRDDGLVDILLFGIAAPLAQSVLQRIRDAAEPVGLFDDRLADRRRLDAAVDLMLGRTGSACAGGCATECSSGAGCGCRPGAPVPCGAQVKVLVPLGAALGTTNEVATLAGHGPLEPDLLQQLLLNNPLLRPVFVDDHGVPVALGRRQSTPQRWDPEALRRALLDLAASPPGRFHPRHPADHPRRPGGQPGTPADPQRAPDDHSPASHYSGRQPDLGAPLGDLARRPDPGGALNDPGGPPDLGHKPEHPGRDAPPLDGSWSRPANTPANTPALGATHPPDTPGPYAVTGLLRELVFTRAPLCEFPACGAKAEHCDAEHDLAHPEGPTCACNLGPCCRRHHRVKQQGWTKTRQHDSAVAWTSPTGRCWLSPSQHQPPAAPVRPLPALRAPDPLDELSPTYADDELWRLLGRPDDPAAYELRAIDADPDDVDPDPLGNDTRWTLDLTDPYAWTEPAPLA